MSWQVWNLDRARPVGAPMHNMRDALRRADQKGDRYTVIPVPLAP